jgi:hypothetical protein
MTFLLYCSLVGDGVIEAASVFLLNYLSDLGIGNRDNQEFRF